MICFFIPMLMCLFSQQNEFGRKKVDFPLKQNSMCGIKIFSGLDLPGSKMKWREHFNCLLLEVSRKWEHCFLWTWLYTLWNFFFPFEKHIVAKKFLDLRSLIFRPSASVYTRLRCHCGGPPHGALMGDPPHYSTPMEDMAPGWSARESACPGFRASCR